MKKTILAIAIGSAALAMAPATFAQTMSANPGNTAHDGWFINGSVGQAKLDHGHYNDHTTGYDGNFGYRWAVNPSVAIGFEAGYNDLGNIHVKNAFNNKNVINDTKSELHGWTAGVNGHFNINPNWYVSARTGVYGWKGHGVSNDDNPLRKSVDKTDWYGGVGFGYDFNPNWSLGLNYDYYHAKKDHLDLSTNVYSVSAEYRF
ncbi:porin family protein [Oleiagrimonas sp. C23AA]|uniref:porin family protein n=1 Tax=Oleiagrimonas sp. C23AA TaxID=2719047 RepID=UPI00141FA3C8|nr:porin family protein [Oleiagrimonas sp. C23AA]NII12366.1 porin family protein [Oleiagrimonas sp. C23AA]